MLNMYCNGYKSENLAFGLFQNFLMIDLIQNIRKTRQVRLKLKFGISLILVNIGLGGSRSKVLMFFSQLNLPRP